MKIFQLSDNENCIYFCNYNRVDEKIIFNEVLAILKNDNSFIIKDKFRGPYEDIYRCNIGKHSFDLILDIDYGTFIKCDNKSVVEFLKAYFDD